MRLRIPDPSLVVLCGPAASGKSTFAHRHFIETAIVSSDRCRAMIADDERNIAVSREAFALFHQIIESRLRYRRLTVADSTALQADARRTLRQLAGRMEIPAVLIVFDLQEETCCQWDERRSRRVGRPVIHQQWTRLQQALRQVHEEGYSQVVMLGEAELSKTRVEIVRAPAEAEGGSPIPNPVVRRKGDVD